MGAYIVAGFVFAITCLVCCAIVFANGMAPAPGTNDTPILPAFVVGAVIAVLVAATHFLPHIGW
jgi:hypothetical protein